MTLTTIKQVQARTEGGMVYFKLSAKNTEMEKQIFKIRTMREDGKLLFKESDVLKRTLIIKFL